MDLCGIAIVKITQALQQLCPDVDQGGGLEELLGQCHFLQNHDKIRSHDVVWMGRCLSWISTFLQRKQIIERS